MQKLRSKLNIVVRVRNFISGWKSMNNLQKKYVVAKALQSFSLAWSTTIYVLFVLSHGYELSLVNLLNIVFMTTIFITDPFSGAIGDRYGHKKIYIVGSVLWGIGSFVYGLGTSFWWFAAAEFLAALGYAAQSEALETLTENQLTEIESTFARGRAQTLAYLSSATAAIMGSIIGDFFGYQWPWLIGGTFNLILAIYILKSLGWQDEVGEIVSEKPITIWQNLKSGLKLSWKNTNLRFLLFFTFILNLSVQSFNMFWTAVLDDISGSSWWLGFMWMGISVALAYGASKTENLKSVKKADFAKLLIFMSAPMLIAALVPQWYLIAGFFILHEVFRGPVRNFSYKLANPEIPDNQRSAVNSFRSAVGTGGAAAGLALSGLLVEVLDPRHVWLVSIMILVFTAVSILIISLK